MRNPSGSTDPRAGVDGGGKASAHQGLALIVTATVALSFKGILARFAYAEGVSVDMLLVLRFALAMPLFVLGARLLRDRSAPPLTRADWRACIASGALFFAAAWFDFHAVALAGAALSRIVLFTFPVIVLLIRWVGDGRRPAPREWGAFALTYGGLLFVIGPGIDTAATGLGVAAALGAAGTYALFWSRTQDLTRRIGSARFNGIANTTTFVVMLVVLLPTLDAADYMLTAKGVAIVAAITVFCTVLPFFLMFEGIRRLGAAEAGLITLFGPAVTVVAAWALLGERLGPPQLAGFALVTVGLALLRRRNAA